MADTIKRVETRKTERKKEETVSTLNVESKSKSEAPRKELAARSEERAYHEIPGLRHETRDVLKQLDSNIQLLEDLGGRLSFSLAEVRGLIRK